MFRFIVHRSIAVLIPLSVAIAATCLLTIRISAATGDAASSAAGACALIAAVDIAKTTGLTVGNGTAGTPIPGVLGRCTWVGEGTTKVILTLADSQHMELTINVQEGHGTAVSGLGMKAVGAKAAGFMGGGYTVNVLDTKGGFGISILGKEGTQERAVALAKLIESRR